MTTQHQPQNRTFQLSPSAALATGLLQQHFADLLSNLASDAEAKGYTVSDHEAQKVPDRLQLALTYIKPRIEELYSWLFTSRETSNFTYYLSESNLNYLACFVGAVTGINQRKAREYIAELENDEGLKSHVRSIATTGTHYIDIDHDFDFGRRLGWYAIIRATKPKMVVETGVEQGLGSLVITSALKRNKEEGALGQYRGIDINPQAGYLFQGEYRDFGTLLYGDSIETLRGFSETVDLFINDSDHSSDYERREYEIITPKLSSNAIVLGDNAHVTDNLYQFAERSDKRFLFFQEKAQDHWYPGAGIGAAF